MGHLRPFSALAARRSLHKTRQFASGRCDLNRHKKFLRCLRAEKNTTNSDGESCDSSIFLLLGLYRTI